MKEKEVMEYIESLSKYGSVLGLDNMKHLLAKLDNPQDKLSFVHIAGTNGKGSTLAYISTILKEAGYKVGRYISPTIRDYRERIQYNGRMIGKKDLGHYVECVKAACDTMVEEGFSHPTPFEVETAIGFLYFLDKKCDIVVLETGLGGRLDATNVIKTTITSVITSVSMDHMGFLGDSIEEIAREKCGIIKPGVDVVSAAQKETVEQVIIEECEKLNCNLNVVNTENIAGIKYGIEKQRFNYKEYKNLEITLAGVNQIENAALAVEVISSLAQRGFPVKEKDLRAGLLKTEWHGRFQVLSKRPYFIVDGAHNEDAAKKLAESVRFYFTNKRIIYIMGVLRDKEYEKVIEHTHSYADFIITVTPPENPRALHAYDLAQAVRNFQPNVTAADSLEEAVEMAYLLSDKESIIMTFGSLSYLGRIMDIVENKQAIRSDTHGKQREN